jgi:hypothetical protein
MSARARTGRRHVVLRLTRSRTTNIRRRVEKPFTSECGTALVSDPVGGVNCPPGPSKKKPHATRSIAQPSSDRPVQGARPGNRRPYRGAAYRGHCSVERQRTHSAGQGIPSASEPHGPEEYVFDHPALPQQVNLRQHGSRRRAMAQRGASATSKPLLGESEGGPDHPIAAR